MGNVLRPPPNGTPATARAEAFRRGGSRRASALAGFALGALTCASLVWGCDHRPQTTVVFDNDYGTTSTRPLVVYRAFWQAVTFPDPVLPGTSSEPKDTFPASSNTAYAVLAPGWDPASSTPPAAFVVLQSRTGFEAHLNDALHITVDDANFMGNCAAGNTLSQAQADFITQLIFPSDFASLRYDAATCTATSIVDGGVP